MNTAELTQHVTATGSISSEVYRALDKMARLKSPGAANYRVAYSTMPICWGCDDKDFVAIVGLVPFEPAELIAAGFEPAVADAQALEIGMMEGAQANRDAERSAQFVALKASRDAALQALIGRTLELPRKLTHDGYRHVFAASETTERFFVVDAGLRDMGGDNRQPSVTLQAEDGQSAYVFIRHLISADKLEVESQCAALLEFAL